jgi:hypothetical protein
MDEHLEPQPPPQHPVQWQPLLLIGITATVVGGLALKGLTSVSFHDLLLFGALPLAALFVLLVLLALWGNRRARRAEEVQWRGIVTHAVASLLLEVQRLKLADVIEAAEARGWTGRTERRWWAAVRLARRPAGSTSGPV